MKGREGEGEESYFFFPFFYPPSPKSLILRLHSLCITLLKFVVCVQTSEVYEISIV